MVESETTAANKKVTTRSPSFPYIPLREAIDRAQQIYDAARAHPARLEAVASHWGYSVKSSGARQTISALRQFGLIEGEGSVKLTPLALKILFSEEPERSALVKEAALAPPSHMLLWNRYGTSLPNEKNLRMYLVLEEGFNENSVYDFLKEYRATISYAQLREADMMPPADEGYDEASSGGAMQQQERPVDEKVAPPPVEHRRSPLVTSEVEPVTFPLLDGNAVELRLRRKIDPEEVEDLRAVFEIWLRKVVNRG